MLRISVKNSQNYGQPKDIIPKGILNFLGPYRKSYRKSCRFTSLKILLIGLFTTFRRQFSSSFHFNLFPVFELISDLTILSSFWSASIYVDFKFLKFSFPFLFILVYKSYSTIHCPKHQFSFLSFSSVFYSSKFENCAKVSMNTGKRYFLNFFYMNNMVTIKSVVTENNEINNALRRHGRGLQKLWI